jgi:hypothetical protein
MPTKRELENSAKYIEKIEKLIDDIQRAERLITQATGILALLQDELETIMSRTDLSNNTIV